MFILLVLLNCSNCTSSNCRLMVDVWSGYFPSAELWSLPNIRCIIALVFIWLAWLLLRDCNFVEFRYDEELILYEGNELWVDILMIHINLPCWYCSGGWVKYLGLQMWYLFWRSCEVGRPKYFTHPPEQYQQGNLICIIKISTQNSCPSYKINSSSYLHSKKLHSPDCWSVTVIF